MKTPTGTSFGFVANNYLDFMEERRQPQTFAYKRTIINRLLEFLGGDFIIQELPDSTVENYLVHLKQEASGKTANRHCKELSILWNWAIKRNHIQKNPWRAAEPFPEEKFIRQVPTLEEIQKVREVATPEERDWIDALYYTGARIGEITHLEWKNIDFELNTITLYTRKRKGGNHEPRTLSLAPAFRELLERRNKRRTADLVFPTRYGNPQPRSGSFLVGLFSRNCQKAKVTKFTAHGIRHHVATRLKDSRQATSYQIQAFLGHMNHSTTERYLHDLAVDRDVPHLLTLENLGEDKE
jgi:integrase